jgi:hypothetical protein
MEKRSVEVWIAMNDDGDAVASVDGGAEARELLIDNYGGAAVRTVKLTVQMAPPEVLETEVEIGDEAGETQWVEAEAAA